jgi:NAD(P)-dependent dehydrogenase (short-subunit alcohol dehydrogenase family)
MTDPMQIVLTGASRGLGLEFTRRYLEAGHRVVATCRHPDRARGLHELAERHGGQLRIAACDVADPAACARIADLVPSDRIDLLIHNAGVFGGDDETIEEVDLDEVARAFDVNALGPLRVTRGLWWRLGEGSRIVAVTSLMGSIADNTSGGRYGYRMSKAALNMAVRCLGHDCRPRGMVSFAIHPGWVRTDMGGPSAPLSIEESVASMVATIASRTVEHDGMFFDRDGEVLPW